MGLMVRQDSRPRRRLDPAQRQAAILLAAVEEFVAVGYDGATLAAVAQRSESSEALLYRYFPSKAALYASALEESLDALGRHAQAQREAAPAGTSTRDRVSAGLVAVLEFTESSPLLRATHHSERALEPREAIDVRREMRRAELDELTTYLRPQPGDRYRFALEGFLGFVDAGVTAWVAGGCRDEERWSLVDACLGCLEGALGDWGTLATP